MSQEGTDVGRTVVLMTLATLLVACTTRQPPPQPRDVRAEMRAANEQFAATFAEQDAATPAGPYTTGAQLLPLRA